MQFGDFKMEKQTYSAGFRPDIFRPLTQEERNEKAAVSFVSYGKASLEPIYAQFLEAGLSGIEKDLGRPDDRCTKDDNCRILACGLENGYVDSVRPNTECVEFSQLRSTQARIPTQGEPIIQPVIFSFQVGGGVNGYRFSSPLTPFTMPNHELPIACLDNNYGFDNFCTNILKYEKGQTVRFLLVAGDPQNINDPPHSFHLHGHKMKLLAEGQATTDPTTGIAIDPSLALDYTIVDSKYVQFGWNYFVTVNANFQPDFYQNLKFLENGVSKDTWLVSSGAWKLVEVKLDNPGLFLFHCHMDSHQLEGQQVLIQVGDKIPMPRPKDNFPTCGNFNPSIQKKAFKQFFKYQEKFPRQDVKTNGVQDEILDLMELVRENYSFVRKDEL